MGVGLMARTLIGTTLVASNNTTQSYTFSSISQSYTHLCLWISGKTSESTAGNYGYANIALNTSVTANYYRSLYIQTPTSTNAMAAQGATPEFYGILGTDLSAGYSQNELWIPYYTSTYGKEGYVTGGSTLSTTSTDTGGARLWRSVGYNTASAISSITISWANSKYFQAGTRFSLYGIS